MADEPPGVWVCSAKMLRMDDHFNGVTFYNTERSMGIDAIKLLYTNIETDNSRKWRYSEYFKLHYYGSYIQKLIIYIKTVPRIAFWKMLRISSLGKCQITDSPWIVAQNVFDPQFSISIRRHTNNWESWALIQITQRPKLNLAHNVYKDYIIIINNNNNNNNIL